MTIIGNDGKRLNHPAWDRRMRARHEIREQLYREGGHNSDELRELQLEVLLDIRDLLQQPAQHCPDCCYVTHGGQPSEERVRLQK